jgi:hypothetical protein
MIDKWLKNDLQDIYASRSVAVFIDGSGDAEFLLKTVEGEYTIQQANSEVEELHAKYLVEKAQPSHERFLIYTRSKKDELKFIREYCETNGCLEIRFLHNYVKAKVHQALNLNINLPPEDLLAAAKVSVGKDKTYWMDLIHKGPAEIFDLKKELLPFVHDPKLYAMEKYDAHLRKTFYLKVNEMLGQEYFSKPPETLAREVVNSILDKLIADTCHPDLEAVYHNWLDSVSYKESFKGYLDQYKLPEGIDIWGVNLNHPFRQIDENWLLEIGQQVADKKDVSRFLEKIQQRHQSKQAKAIGITFWKDVITLLTFDPGDINYLNSFTECVEFYTNHFCRLDTAIRNLYAQFLYNKNLLEPFQERYRQYVTIFLDKWFKQFDGYQDTQTGTLQRIIDNNPVKTAIIVGDGVAYEVASQIAGKVNQKLKLTNKIILADVPTETENNMSRIYMNNRETEKVHANREKYLLKQNPDTTIDFVKLDDIRDEAGPAQFLICTYKDIDSMGEKLQQKALKYFPETIDIIADKVDRLISSGYAKVFLISDHGFVLTGLLSESDKISIAPDGVSEKTERYLRTTDKQALPGSQYIEIKKSHGPFGYLYFSKNMSPFKTPGVYGFSHGGITPQEMVTPFFCWERTGSSVPALAVGIHNKEDLKSVTGDIFQVKIASKKGSEDLFTMERKIYLVFFSNKKQINKSDVFTIQQDQVITKEYTFDGRKEIEVQLLDAKSKEQLDHAKIKQNMARDLGGLI